MLTSTDTVLVIGTDQRPKGSKEPGANIATSGMPLGHDHAVADRRRHLAAAVDPARHGGHHPRHGTSKINAAYAYGGPALAIKTVEQLTGVKINHIIVVNLANFPKFIDAIGGVDVTTGRICSEISGGVKNGGFTLYLRAGDPSPRRPRRADAGPHAREPLQRGQQRPDPRGLPAEDPQRDQVQAAVPRHVLPPALGLVVRAADGPHRHGRRSPC